MVISATFVDRKIFDASERAVSKYRYSKDRSRVSGSISCSGVPKDDNASEMLDLLDCFSTLSRWKAILQEVVSAALVYDQSISTNEMLESESRYLTG